MNIAQPWLLRHTGATFISLLHFPALTCQGHPAGNLTSTHRPTSAAFWKVGECLWPPHFCILIVKSTQYSGTDTLYSAWPIPSSCSDICLRGRTIENTCQTVAFQQRTPSAAILVQFLLTNMFKILQVLTLIHRVLFHKWLWRTAGVLAVLWNFTNRPVLSLFPSVFLVFPLLQYWANNSTYNYNGLDFYSP